MPKRRYYDYAAGIADESEEDDMHEVRGRRQNLAYAAARADETEEGSGHLSTTLSNFYNAPIPTSVFHSLPQYLQQSEQSFQDKIKLCIEDGVLDIFQLGRYMAWFSQKGVDVDAEFRDFIAVNHSSIVDLSRGSHARAYNNAQNIEEKSYIGHCFSNGLFAWSLHQHYCQKQAITEVKAENWTSAFERTELQELELQVDKLSPEYLTPDEPPFKASTLFTTNWRLPRISRASKTSITVNLLRHVIESSKVPLGELQKYTFRKRMHYREGPQLLDLPINTVNVFADITADLFGLGNIEIAQDLDENALQCSSYYKNLGFTERARRQALIQRKALRENLLDFLFPDALKRAFTDIRRAVIENYGGSQRWVYSRKMPLPISPSNNDDNGVTTSTENGTAP